MAKTKTRDKAEERTKERVARFSTDDLLRKQGFSIERRKRGLPVLWRLCGEVVTEEEALAMVEDAESDEDCKGK